MSFRGLLSRPGVIIVLLALAATVSSLGNGFVYDDVPIILQNRMVQNLGASERIWNSSYWSNGLLYRPLTIQLFALEWALGEGRRIVFHAVSIGLMVGVAFAFWRLARRLLSPGAALFAAALFAVHPVHVESVGNVVGQSELLTTLFALLAVIQYLVWRADGFTARRRIALAALTLLAILAKETGYVIPALLIAVEVWFPSPGRADGSRRRDVGGVMLWQAGALISSLLVRMIVLSSPSGELAAPALFGLTTAERIAGMLAVVPEWARLLLWPAHLQAEYGPPAVPVTGPFGLAHLLGLATLVVSLTIVFITRRRAPVIAFGLTWVVLALGPVSNVFMATGVILAERTLFLASAGAMLAVGGAVALFFPRLDASTRLTLRHPGAVLIGVLVMAGMLRSIERQRAWREQAGFIRRLEAEAPRTYRAQLVVSRYYSETGRLPEAARAAARAYDLFKDDAQVFEQYGQILRRQGRCHEASPILEDGARRFPDRTVVRSRLIECALALGDTARALELAREAVRIGQPEFGRTVARLSPSAPPMPGPRTR